MSSLNPSLQNQLAPLTIRSAQGDYRVEFWEDLPSALALLTNLNGIFLVIDRKVEALYRSQLSGLTSKWPTFLLDADERVKTLDGVAQLSTWLQEKGANKRSRLVAIGGGIIQDICAFTSHIYYRGIPWTFFPTTLLSMCDSCIGAKSSINHGKAKNQLGAFHSPREVHVVPQLLSTLETRDIKSGYGEILKLMLTQNLRDFESLETVLKTHEGNLLNPELPAIIRRSLEIKKAVIEVDEFEADLRRILNFGHTFGHAIESMSDYEVPHGLAVAWGIDLVNHISVKKGLLSGQLAARIRRLIQSHLSVQLRYLPTVESLIEGIRKDKKAETSLVKAMSRV